ncbi:DUF4105 domain-containing protein [Ilyomonas limi]|uniref:DUF4105 domain-containing protein n=1 Tax=Ilyomonas limi TaxID=2575867 RepID=A0A4U3L022_9BACT|nr:DUF4105 domain-containing protein [Ilyomonas limi]TKK67519.1 DUF4105 domain-containing protein [Ilyomonas limi]
MKFLRFALLFCFFHAFFCSAQAQDSSSCHVRISLLTCAPGQELYSTFGHTAIRITDSITHMDVVYNYGTFNFDDPNFYMKFIRGKLDYFLSAAYFPDFMYEYKEDQRSVTEQVLNLTCAQKAQIVHALETNMQAANRAYKYDFIYDNCTTRVRDLIFESLPGSGGAKQLVPEGTTARNLIHVYLDSGGEPWSKLGIDILLGAKLDKPLDNKVAMFLPDYLMKGVDSAVIHQTQLLVAQKSMLLNVPSPIIAGWNYAPLATFAIICVLMAVLYLAPGKRAKTIARFLDSFLLYFTGLLGILLLFMWFGTDHKMTKDNYNLLWALPTNVVAAFFLWRNPLWLRRYFYVAFIINAILFAAWFWLPQEINVAIAPLVLLMLFRYAKLAQLRP